MGKAPNFDPSSLDMLRSDRRSDPLVAGLCGIVSVTGTKTWTYRRRIAKPGAIVQLTLGTYPAHTNLDARESASGLNAALERGEDPALLAPAQDRHAAQFPDTLACLCIVEPRPVVRHRAPDYFALISLSMALSSIESASRFL
ncbi:Arm DNA-binding domain-containing protein [Aurantiacibacter flavus]|uniref:Arm DNA-binding domain-containing protein n=1 Tax=Aurantiacibacter flavus TaxID=3145232 RepID=A0ABV0CU43_9SPHN